jgi:hypothetical protein
MRRERAKTMTFEERHGRPFIGCDGEGTSRRGQHDYALFRIGDRELYAGGRRLTTPELLSFILEAPPPHEAILVGFAFEYDVSNILRDVRMQRDKPDVPSRMERILDRDKDFKNPWTWLSFDGWPEFGVSYLPRHYLKVCYGEKYEHTFPSGEKAIRRRSKPRSIRTIEDAFGFFQAPFLKAINNWDIGRQHWESIKKNKARRSSFRSITAAIRDYNRLECELLSQMMAALREATMDAGIVLDHWDGAGRIAVSMLKANGALKREALEKSLPPDLLKLAGDAYYGGRFEVTRVGKISEPVTECDINSAYPAALQDAPCHVHGRWRKVSKQQLQAMLDDRKSDALFVAPVHFYHKAMQGGRMRDPREERSFLCGLPFRQKSGAIMWPINGRGVYWSVELRSAKRLGARIEVLGHGWVYVKRCQCQPYGWLKQIFEARKALGKAKKGIPLKLGSNSVYGKLAQSIGGAPWRNLIDAGLATAGTRAKLNDAIAAAGITRVVMLATDAVYVTGEPPLTSTSGKPDVPWLDVGDGLGQWEVKTHPGLFIVQPGLYWPPKSPGWRVKTRGISPKFFEPVTGDFEREWLKYIKKRKRPWASLEMMGVPPPIVPTPLTAFIGLRLAMHRKAYDKVCKWVKEQRAISFKWDSKRSGAGDVVGNSVILRPKQGDHDAWSESYDPTDTTIQDDNLVYDELPDAVDLTAPHK